MKGRIFAYSFSILFQLRYKFKQYLIRKSHYCIGMALSLYTTLCHTSLNFFLHRENFVCTGMKSTVNTFLYEFFVVQSRGDPIQALRGSLQSKLGRWVGGRMPDIIEQNFPLRTKLLSSKSNTLNANKMKIEWPQY